MRRIFPDWATDIDLAVEYADSIRRRHDGRPWVVQNMIASLDGAASIGGRSGGLGGPADKAVFALLRALADVILVGAETVRAESYGPPKKPGQRIAVVTRRTELDWESPLFSSGAALVVLPEDGPEVPVSSVRAGRGAVDLRGALRLLDADVVLAEGGPSINGLLLADGLIDELCLTVAPTLAGGDAPRIVRGESRPTAMRLVRLLEDDGYLFARYLVE
jgi:riboflavin biosynthesis pyrimidine reductase